MNSPSSYTPSSAGPLRFGLWLLVGLLVLLLSVQTYYSLGTQKSLGWDASMGLLTLESSLAHYDFNQFEHPDPANIGLDRSEFVAWWTPGHYLVPYWVSKCLAVDLGTSLRVVAALCSLCGVIGYGLLYIKLGFDRLCVVLSLMIICGQWYYLKHSTEYSGGELLLFSVAPYIALVVLSMRTVLFGRVLVAAILCYIALFLKAAALALFFATLLYMALELLGWPGGGVPKAASDFQEKRGLLKRQLLGLAWAGALFVLVAYLVYFSKGTSVASTSGNVGFLGKLEAITYPLAGPLYGAFSFMEGCQSPIYYLPVALISLLAIWKLGGGWKTEKLQDYRRLLVSHFVVYYVFFAYAYVYGMDIAFEGAHFRVVGLLVIPGLIQVLLSFRYRLLIVSALVALSIGSVAVFHWDEISHPPRPVSSSRLGLRQPLSNESLEALHQIDRRDVHADTIVYNGFAASPSLLLEFENGRKLQDDNLANFGFRQAGRRNLPCYRNTADSIIFIIPRRSSSGQGRSLEAISRTFERRLKVLPCFDNSELTVYMGGVD